MTRITVGVSPSNDSPRALLAAAAHAQQSGAQLVAVQAWRPERSPTTTDGHSADAAIDADASRAAAEAALRHRVEQTLGAGVPVICELVRGSAHAVLVAQSKTADLLVLDAPRRREPTRMPLAHRLVYSARCPLLIMPADAGSTAVVGDVMS